MSKSYNHDRCECKWKIRCVRRYKTTPEHCPNAARRRIERPETRRSSTAGLGQLATYRCSADYLAPSGQLWKQRKEQPPPGRPGTRADAAGPANGAVRVN